MLLEINKNNENLGNSRCIWTFRIKCNVQRIAQDVEYNMTSL